MHFYNIGSVGEVNFSYFRQQEIFNRKDLDYTANSYSLSLRRDISSRIHLKGSLQYQTKNKAHEEEKSTIFMPSLCYNLNKKHLLSLTGLIKKNILSNEDLSEKLLTSFFISYTFNFLENPYTRNRKNFPLYESLDLLA
jgi:hypothetical protein